MSHDAAPVWPLPNSSLSPAKSPYVTSFIRVGLLADYWVCQVPLCGMPCSLPFHLSSLLPDKCPASFLLPVLSFLTLCSPSVSFPWAPTALCFSGLHSTIKVKDPYAISVFPPPGLVQNVRPNVLVTYKCENEFTAVNQGTCCSSSEL